jgi:hypothetical protein
MADEDIYELGDDGFDIPASAPKNLDDWSAPVTSADEDDYDKNSFIEDIKDKLIELEEGCYKVFAENNTDVLIVAVKLPANTKCARCRSSPTRLDIMLEPDGGASNAKSRAFAVPLPKRVVPSSGHCSTSGDVVLIRLDEAGASVE